MRLCFPGDNVAPSIVARPQGSGQTFLDASLQKAILVLCNIFRGFSLHVQPKVTQSERGKFLSVAFSPMPAPRGWSGRGLARPRRGQLGAGGPRAMTETGPSSPHKLLP